jgi:hypothetical protein
VSCSDVTRGRVAPVERAREQTHLSEHHAWIRSRFDFAVVALLGVTVMAIAWGAYKTEVAGKDADHYFNRSDETLSTAHKLDLRAAAAVDADEQIFLELERERAEGRTKTIARLRRSLFTPAFLAAVRWWERQPPASRPVSPFSAANPRYRNVASVRASALDAKATAYLDRAHHAEAHGIDYTVVTVILTIALFLFGITTQLSPLAVRYSLVVAGILIVLGSIARFVDLSL